jgi:ribosomal-protein-alanine N-acetyltransferase
MLIKPLSSSELDLAAALDCQVNHTPWSQYSYHEAFNNPQQVLWGAYDESGMLCGVCVFSQVLDEAEILQLWVRIEKLRQGIGRYLLQQVITELQTQAVRSLFLEVMLANLPAINLYSSLGFNVIGKRKGYYKINGKLVDALVMAADLTLKD